MRRIEKASTPPSRYDVGYRRPPKETQFAKKGKSGNPRGSPDGQQGRRLDGRDPAEIILGKKSP